MLFVAYKEGYSYFLHFLWSSTQASVSQWVPPSCYQVLILLTTCSCPMDRDELGSPDKEAGNVKDRVGGKKRLKPREISDQDTNLIFSTVFI